MTTNLIDVLRKSFTEKSHQDISQYVGINSESAKNGIHAIIPAVLASILGNNTVNNAVRPTWWNALKDDYPYNENEFIDTSTVKAPSFLTKGREIQSGMFRTSHDDLVTSVSSVAGVQKEKAAGLIEMTVPLIMGYLNNWMLRKGWKFKDLIQNLFDHKTDIVGALPTGISPAHFGINNRPNYNFSETIEAKIPTHGAPQKKSRNGLMWLIGLILLALLLWYFIS